MKQQLLWKWCSAFIAVACGIFVYFSLSAVATALDNVQLSDPRQPNAMTVTTLSPTGNISSLTVAFLAGTLLTISSALAWRRWSRVA